MEIFQWMSVNLEVHAKNKLLHKTSVLFIREAEAQHHKNGVGSLPPQQQGSQT